MPKNSLVILDYQKHGQNKGGKCMVCNKMKRNLTDHHVKECNKEIMMVCHDCHKVITWYQDQTVPEFKKQLTKSKATSKSKTKKVKKTKSKQV